MTDQTPPPAEARARTTRRQFLRAAAVATPVAVVGAGALAAGTGASASQPAAGPQVVHDFRHLGRRVLVTRSATGLDLAVDGHAVTGAIAVRSDGVLACPDYLPYSDADWGTDIEALARRLLDGNGTDYILF